MFGAFYYPIAPRGQREFLHSARVAKYGVGVPALAMPLSLSLSLSFVLGVEEYCEMNESLDAGRTEETADRFSGEDIVVWKSWIRSSAETRCL